MDTARQQHAVALRVDAQRHEHRFGERRRAVVDAGVRHLEAEQDRDVGLELERRLERSLADLRLIRRVRGGELGSARDLLHDGGNEMAIATRALKRCRKGVALSERRHLGYHLALAQPFGKIELRAQA
jgi:hypothetical protein